MQYCSRRSSTSAAWPAYNSRMDVTILAQSTGIFKWRVRRHLRPAVFARLSGRDLAKYCDALGIGEADLLTVPAAE